MHGNAILTKFDFAELGLVKHAWVAVEAFSGAACLGLLIPAQR